MMVDARQKDVVELPSDDEDDGETEAERAPKTKLPAKRPNSTSKYRGVMLVQDRGLWAASFYPGSNGKGRRLRLFSDERVAAAAWDQRARAHFKDALDKESLNFPTGPPAEVAEALAAHEQEIAERDKARRRISGGSTFTGGSLRVERELWPLPPADGVAGAAQG
jgi:hypothetical protein